MGSVLADAFHASPAEVAWTELSFAYALGFLLFGPLSDRANHEINEAALIRITVYRT
ncbi:MULTISPECIES: hypothetical protein [unclassified Paenibacillus]|uniref:hypothetical protein n=1 Tax=unclassified Paenibacillus TaxID=185978 RepID=UPI003630F844